MSIRLPVRFRPSVASVRLKLNSRECVFFDFLCFVAVIGFRLPFPDVNLTKLPSARGHRRRVLRGLSRIFRGRQRTTPLAAWAQTGDRLVRLLVNEMTSRGLAPKPGAEKYDKYDPLNVLLAYIPSGLALDGTVPQHPLLRLAWTMSVRLFAELYPSAVKPVRLTWLDSRRLTILRREAAGGFRKGRTASGQRPGLAGRKLALDPRLMAEVGNALGKKVSPGREARYIFYTRPGDYFWPHPDDPEYAVNVFVCLDHRLPSGRSTRSAFLAYRPDGSVERYEIPPGTALAVESQGLVHAREPVKRCERITILAIALHDVPRNARAASRH